MAQINKPTDYFNTVLYTGTGSALSVTGTGFQPDMTWIKRRNAANGHLLQDGVRGATNVLFPDGTGAEVSGGTYFTSFDSDGFTVTSNAASGASGGTYASWNWLAGGTASSNTDGDITSSVSVNTTSGFSIVSYTGNGSNSTVGHGLGVAPKVVIVKQRTTGTYNWVWGSDLLTDWGYILKLNLTDAESSTAGTQSCFNSTAPTSNVFTVGTSAATNNNTDNFIAYCFAEKKGFSKFGSYTGNGSTDGTFVYTGFKPAWLLVKRTDSATSWKLLDNKRDSYNDGTGANLNANTSDAEDDNVVYAVDFLSNGFKIRNTNGNFNTSGANHIYMAFAESPLVGTNNIPATAR